MNRFLLIMLVIISIPTITMAEIQPSISDSTSSLPSPKMRVVDRDWSYFKAIPCDKINHTAFHSRSEEILLAKRKKQCLEKYKAFLPAPVDR